MTEGATDESLMLAYRSGDASAFDQLYRRWRGPLFRYFRHQCGDAVLAEELYQDVWMRIIAARANYEVAAKFSTWLFRIAHNRLVDHWRAAGRAEIMESLDQDDDGHAAADLAVAPQDWIPERLQERRELAGHLVAAIGALPAAQREAFLMAEEGGMTLEEIANATGTGRETVKSRLRYALGKLRAELKEWR
jgi:RNA polymerase sigma-70 factor (ECF subfamily)